MSPRSMLYHEGSLGIGRMGDRSHHVEDQIQTAAEDRAEGAVGREEAAEEGGRRSVMLLYDCRVGMYHGLATYLQLIKGQIRLD